MRHLMRRSHRFLNRSVLGIRVWILSIAVVTIAAAAGQAVGPVLTGSTTGTIGVTVESSMALDLDAGAGLSGITVTGTHGVAVRNDEGTSFLLAMELAAGDDATINLLLQNNSGKPLGAVLELDVPNGIDVEVEGIAPPLPVDACRLGRKTWLVSVAADTGVGDNDGLAITIEPKDEMPPGFYSITGRIVVIGGDLAALSSLKK